MKALLLAAGLGTRLRPLTNNRPKALVEAGGKSLLERNILYLKHQGITEIIINVHHFGEQIIDFVHTHDFGIPLHISDERNALLDTGGGLRKAASFFQGEKNFIVYNVDVLCDMNLQQMAEAHQNQGNIVTMAVRHRPTQRQLVFDADSRLLRRSSGESDMLSQGEQRAAFSGIHILSTRIFSLLPEKDCFPIMPEYLKLATDYPLRAYFHDDSFWMDMGKPEALYAFENIL